MPQIFAHGNAYGISCIILLITELNLLRGAEDEPKRSSKRGIAPLRRITRIKDNHAPPEFSFRNLRAQRGREGEREEEKLECRGRRYKRWRTDLRAIGAARREAEGT